jgi:cytochrome c oxidase subunit 2
LHAAGDRYSLGEGFLFMFQYVKRIVLIMGLSLAGSATEASSLTTSSSTIEQNIHGLLFYLFSGLTGIIFVVLIYCLIKNRQTKGAEGTHFHPHLGLELIWTTLPLVILVALAIPAVIQFIHSHG